MEMSNSDKYKQINMYILYITYILYVLCLYIIDNVIYINIVYMG